MLTTVIICEIQCFICQNDLHKHFCNHFCCIKLSNKSYNTYIFELNVLKKPSIVAAMMIRNNVLFLSELKPLNFNRKVTHKCFFQILLDDFDSLSKLHQLFRKNLHYKLQAGCFSSDVNC